MAKQDINIGTVLLRGRDGDKNREANIKVNKNFTELYKAMGAVFDGQNSGDDGAILPNFLPISKGGTGNAEGHALTAGKLKTAVNINGVPFDGSQSINITYAAMTNTEAQTGTGTTDKTITPAVLKSAIQYHAPEQTDISGNAATASKLASAVNINGVPFDGSQSINIETGIIYAAMTNTEVQQGTSTSEKVITPAVLKSAIQYHAPEQTDISGNAATATKLATAVNINGVPFDGSQSISIGGTGEGGSGAIYSVMTNTEVQQGTSTSEKVITPAILKYAIQYHAPEQTDISGNAASATILQTDRTIGGVPFNGSENINLPGVNITGNQSTSGASGLLTNLGQATALAEITEVPPRGLTLVEAYNNGYPASYGNVLRLGGIGQGEIFVGWPGSDTGSAPSYIRGKRDNTLTGQWSPWREIVFVDALSGYNVGSANTATKLATPRKINGIDFDGSQDITIGADSNAARKIIAACVYTPASYFGGSFTLISKTISKASEDWVMQTNLAIIPFKVGDIVSMVFSYRTGNSNPMTYNGDTIITAINESFISFSTPGVSGYRDNSNTNVSIGAFISDSNNILSITKNTNSYSVTLESNQNGNNLSLIVDATSIRSTTKLHSTQTASTDLSASFELFYYSIVSNALAATKTVDAQFRFW